jgi:3-hydroxyisobutyrate dehydrogenase-like beta-hydroxyacid dehydrogenase
MSICKKVNKIKYLRFIGLGNMGNPMAAHVAKADFDLTVYEINPEASEKFVVQHGGRVAAKLWESKSGIKLEA